jgi:hypothetical protein
MNRLETSFNHIKSLNKHFEMETNGNYEPIYKENIIGIISNHTNMKTTFQNKNKININININVNVNINITWFLSGGVKFSHPGAKSEASVMKSHIDKFISSKFSSLESDFIKWDFVLDKLSTNTAENFIRASDFLNQTTNSYDSVYIVTSDFHYERASKMMGLIDQSREYKWILGDAEEHYSRSMEKIHIKNVYSDVKKARTLIR